MHKNKLTTIIVVAIATTIAVIVMAIQPIVALVAAGVVCLIGYAAYDERKSRPTKAEAERRKILITYECMFRVIRKISDVLGVQKPTEVGDIITEPQIIFKNGLPFLRLSILKKSANIADEEYLHNAIKILQTTINKTLQSGEFNGLVPCISRDGMSPIFVVDDIKDNGAYIEAEICIVDTPEMSNYVYAKKHRRSTDNSSAKRDDTEF